MSVHVLYRKSRKIINWCDTVARFSVAVKDSDKHFNFVKLKLPSYDILDPVDNQLVVASLRGSDGKEEHCVTIFDKWVFDSNFDYALPLSKEALDLCCSAEDTHDQFVSVKEARSCHYADVLEVKLKQQKQTSQRKNKRKWNRNWFALHLYSDIVCSNIFMWTKEIQISWRKTDCIYICVELLYEKLYVLAYSNMYFMT